MSRQGNGWDKAGAERFFATRELELIMKHRWATRDDGRRASFRCSEGWDNHARRHSTLAYVRPAPYEKRRRNAA